MHVHDVLVILGGAVAAGLGAIFTVAGTYWVSIRLDEQNRLRQLHAALTIVATELVENSRRIKDTKDDKEIGSRLRLGDWAASKPGFAALWSRNRLLWKDVTDTYGTIFAFKNEWPGFEPPKRDYLEDLADRLQREAREVADQMRTFSRILPWPRGICVGGSPPGNGDNVVGDSSCVPRGSANRTGFPRTNA
jgi:hypothetical protein